MSDFTAQNLITAYTYVFVHKGYFSMHILFRFYVSRHNILEEYNMAIILGIFFGVIKNIYLFELFSMHTYEKPKIRSSSLIYIEQNKNSADNGSIITCFKETAEDTLFQLHQHTRKSPIGY